MDYVKKITTDPDLIEKILSKGVRDMPQNPAAQGYNERQIRAFYYIPEKIILELIKSIDDDLSIIFNDIKVNIDNLNIMLKEYQTKTDNTLDTKSKEIVGAINEINAWRVSDIEPNFFGSLYS